MYFTQPRSQDLFPAREKVLLGKRLYFTFKKVQQLYEIKFVFFFFQLNNPDMRVVILKDFVKKHFPTTTVMDYAIEVEKITTSKVT